MASIQKTPQGYRVQIKKRGVRDSRLLPTRREAVEWAAAREAEIVRQADSPPGDLHTLADALDRYEREVSPSKRGEAWEGRRFAAFKQQGLLPLTLPLSQITPGHFAVYRDARRQSVSAGTVLRELTLLSAVFTVARREWRWVESNPVADVKRPAAPAHRDRTINVREIRILLRSCGYARGKPIRSVSQAVGACFLVALRTGMRAGELCSLEWRHVHERYCHLPITKSGGSRDVPLSRSALRAIRQAGGWDDVLVFGLKRQTLDALFRRHRDLAGLSGFTFHDSRHTAATILSRRVDVLTLCKIFGWSSTSQALTYYNPSAASIADMLG